MTSLRLYDSMRRQKVAFEPLQPGKVGMYVCGPTPYAPAHIGHAYSAISFDTIRRSLKFLGFEVNYVRNITDVEDKIINAANAAGEDPMALAGRFATAYNLDMARFNVLAPDVEPKVSTHIAEIVELIEKLVANGSAYAIEGDVYFACDTFKPYGKLSGQSLDDLRAGASDRELVEKGKKSSADFALWKAAKPGEPFWDSPWGKGRPGWHIECSAMTQAHLGTKFDIHGGGKDLIFPHHENEIAQSQGAYGVDTFARHWMHNGFLNFQGVKMSKSEGNVFGCEQIAEVVGGEALRFFCVKHHYRSPIDFEVEKIFAPDGTPAGVRFRSLEAADRELEYFYVTLHKLDAFVAQGGDAGEGAVVPDAEKLVPATLEALSDDFNSPKVMAALHEAATLANKLLVEGKGIDKQVRRRSLARLAKDLRTVGDVLGILSASPTTYLDGRRARLVARKGIDVAHVEALLTDRKAARAAKDFTRGDAIRAELTAMGVELLDTPQGTDWRVHDDAS
ncbi:cysteine--tRNA ligase [soil metagenome]